MIRYSAITKRKIEESEALSAEIERFLADGGVINKIPTGHTLQNAGCNQAWKINPFLERNKAYTLRLAAKIKAAAGG
jgi:hypothetical protein